MDFLKPFASAAGTIAGIYFGYKACILIEKYLDNREKRNGA